MPSHSTRLRPLITATRVAVVLYTLLMMALAGWLSVAADATPAGMLLAFAPRWWLVIPWALLLPASLLDRWPTSVAATAGTLVTLFTVADFEVPTFGPDNSGRNIRVVTYNTDLREAVAFRIRDDLRRWDADVVLLQDCKTAVADSLRAIARTTVTPLAVHVNGRYCLVSRWPLRGAVDLSQLVDPRSDPAGVRHRGSSGMRYVVRTPDGDLPIYSVHLPSPRDALGTVRWLKTTDRRRIASALRRSIDARSQASAMVAGVARRESGRAIVAGDFNLPYRSRILRRDWHDFTNAFAASGTGFGYTMQAGVFPVRIDHILTTGRLIPRRSVVLQGFPSEHQPVVADVQLRP